jgi:hypothetical protein
MPGKGLRLRLERLTALPSTDAGRLREEFLLARQLLGL